MSIFHYILIIFNYLFFVLLPNIVSEIEDKLFKIFNASFHTLKGYLG